MRPVHRLLAVLVLGLGVTLALSGVARAGGVTHTITFTGDGPSPANVRIHDGDRIEFRNDVDPSAGVPVLGPATGALSSVSVTVSGATSGSFTLERGKSAVVGPYHSGTKDLVADYDSTYSSRLVLGALPGPSEQTGGTVTVAGHSAAPGRTTTTTPSSSPEHSASGPTTAATTPPTSNPPTQPSGQPAPSDAAPTVPSGAGPSIYYIPHGPDVAAEIVPRGDSGTYHTDAPRSSAAPRSRSSQSAPAAAGPTAPDDPNDPDNPAIAPAAASSDRPGLPGSPDWTAISALVLLCGVVGVLIRTLVVHRLR
ncbi:MAG TPA: hypothetical protein VHC49_03950 [Mycobacteriales bacterium]|nr:hypothetical protein [Mycobacteriales bacterium]